MKVLSRDGDWKRKARCGSCKARLLIEAADLRVGFFGANYGGETPERKYYVECCECGNSVFVLSLPHWLMRQALENTDAAREPPTR